MGLDFSVYVKTENQKFVNIGRGDYGWGSRYYGPYDGGWYESGDWPEILLTLLRKSADAGGVVYYGHDHIEEKDYMEVTPELVAKITDHFLKKAREK